jgi:hypothetical protein
LGLLKVIESFGSERQCAYASLEQCARRHRVAPAVYCQSVFGARATGVIAAAIDLVQPENGWSEAYPSVLHMMGIAALPILRGIAMGMKNRTAAPTAALVLGLLFASPASIATDAIISTVASLVAAAIGNICFMSPAMAEPAALTNKQSDALRTYNNSRSHFEQVLAQRRAQINSGQPLPNLPGQALYLARNNMMSAYKDLTDALPSKIGGPNKYGIPPAYFSADNEPLSMSTGDFST